MAFMHYADLKAQNYHAGYLHLVVVLCGNSDKVRQVTDKRKSVTCAECLTKLREIPEVPEEARKIDLRQAMLSGRAFSRNPPEPSERLADGAPVVNVPPPPDHRPAPPASEHQPANAEALSANHADETVVFEQA